jgi:hypothetical protein
MDAHTFTKQTLSACQGAIVLWERKRSAHGGIRTTGGHGNIGNVLRNTKKKKKIVGPFRKEDAEF